MKSRLLLIIFLLLLGTDKLFCQSFSYSPIGESFVRVTPTFEERSIEGKQRFELSLPQTYYAEVLKQVYTECLTVSQIDVLKNRGLIVQMCINNKGEVFYVEFGLNKDLQRLVGELELLTIYRALKKVKLDFSKGCTNPSQCELTNNHYVKLVGALVR